MKRTIRITFDIAVILIFIALAAALAIEWINNDYPLYGRDGLLSNRKTLLPWLWAALGSLIIALAAFFDAYIHFKHRTNKPAPD